jgi:beta-1,4-mannosyl-glycoprotein beta-1,4-N-acetylglucosaminyltransferase
MVFDCFPFFNELDVLEIRLNELDPIVDRFVIVESAEMYGGHSKPFNLESNWERFAAFRGKIEYIKLPALQPACKDRASGRAREAYQRDALFHPLMSRTQPGDTVIFSDCDEIPSYKAVCYAMSKIYQGIQRFKQLSFYYNVQTLVDYGHDFASRARIGTAAQLRKCGSMYGFRMHEKNTCPAIEWGGWHFSYFGGPERIKRKVAALSPFLSEYKLFGDEQLERDIAERRDLHHRRCEMPETFYDVNLQDVTLPAFLMENRQRFSHFFRKAAAV